MAKLYGITDHSSYLCINNRKIVLEFDLTRHKRSGLCGIGLTLLKNIIPG